MGHLILTVICSVWYPIHTVSGPFRLHIKCKHAVNVYYNISYVQLCNANTLLSGTLFFHVNNGFGRHIKSSVCFFLFFPMCLYWLTHTNTHTHVTRVAIVAHWIIEVLMISYIPIQLYLLSSHCVLLKNSSIRIPLWTLFILSY